MEPSDLLRTGRFPVLCGPDALELAQGIVEPVAMGTLREVSVRIQTSASTVVAVRGSVVMLEEGGGNGFYDAVVRDLDGTYLRLQTYSPEEGSVFNLLRTSALLSIGTQRPLGAVEAHWELDRAGFLVALLHCRHRSSEDGAFTVHLGEPGSRRIRLDDVRLMSGSTSFRLLGAMRVPDSDEILIQLHSDRHVCYSVVDADFRISWIMRGLAWRHSARLAS